MGRLTTTLLVLQVPIYIFLAFYIYIISRQILRLEQNDISILKSRGTSRGQIILIYLLQSIFVSGLSIALGIPLGLMVCRLLGASNGFLELVSRVAITTNLNRDVFIYSALAAFASMLVMLIPVIGFSKVTIVEHKRSISRKNNKALWQRYFLDILFLGFSIYGYYNFNSRREIMALAVVDVQAMDPMLFISSTLFIIGLGLLCLRLYPYLIKLIFKIGSRLWSPPSYASLLKVIRFSGDEQFIMVFLVFTLSLGIFSATTARTLNINNEHLIQYQVGADLIFAEQFRDNIPAAMPGVATEMPERIIYTEPDFERFTHFNEVDSLTRVMVQEVDTQRGASNISNVTMMAIETNTFGKTAWYRDDLLPIHMNFFLNALALREEGILLSNNFRTRYGFELGERLSYTDEYGNRSSGVIIGFVERWPAFSERVRVLDEGGAYVFEDRFLMVTNLGHIHSTWGMYPYQVWMRTNTTSNRFFYDFTQETGLSFIHFEDAKAAVVSSRNDPILQGTNGILTAGFIFTFLASFTGYLIYWTLSIKSRVLQFGVFRAIGMTKKDLIRLLFYEQILISFSAIAIGSAVGWVTAQLFVPMIQVAYSPSLQKIPLLVVTYGRDYMNIFAIIGLMLFICLIILGVMTSKVNMAGALKLGED
jgi:putative ABC transport system permease protein